MFHPRVSVRLQLRKDIFYRDAMSLNPYNCVLTRCLAVFFSIKGVAMLHGNVPEIPGVFSA